MLIRFRARQEGGHVRLRVFIGKGADYTLANAGSITLSEEEYGKLLGKLNGEPSDPFVLQLYDEDKMHLFHVKLKEVEAERTDLQEVESDAADLVASILKITAREKDESHSH